MTACWVSGVGDDVWSYGRRRLKGWYGALQLFETMRPNER